MVKKSSIFSAALLLAGNAIGTGFFEIPIVSGPAGFFPAAIMSGIVWIYLLLTGFLYLEAILASSNGANVVTITRNLIGPSGVALGIVAFLILNNLYLTSYFAIGSSLITKILTFHFHLEVPTFYVSLGLFLIFGYVIYLGVYVSDRVNYVFFVGFFFAFIVAMFMGKHTVEWHLLTRQKWYFVFFAVPILISGYDYQSILPTLTAALNRNPKKLARMLLIGFSFPIITYTIWQWFVIGSTSPALLWEAYETQKPIYEGFLLLKESSLFEIFLNYASLGSMFTSLIALGLCLIDFYSDCFKVPLAERKGVKRLYIGLLSYIPAFVVSFFTAFVFDKLVVYAIGWAELIFLGILPIWLIARARYILQLSTHRFVPGGKGMLLALGVVTFFFIYIQGVEFIRT